MLKRSIKYYVLGIMGRIRNFSSAFNTHYISPATNQKGFSLVEILITLGIIALVSGIALGLAASLKKTTNDARRQSDLKEIQSALQLFYADHQTYPLANELPFGGLFDSRDSQKIYSKVVPTDPVKPGGYCYLPLPQVNSPISAACTLATQSCHYYVLCANLESPTAGVAACNCSGSNSHNYGVSPI